MDQRVVDEVVIRGVDAGVGFSAADDELGVFAGCGFFTLINPLDVRPHSFDDRSNKAIDLFARSFGDQFDPAVIEVTNVAGHIKIDRDIASGVPKPDALHPPAKIAVSATAFCSGLNHTGVYSG
jgi:hypothetical protein